MDGIFECHFTFKHFLHIVIQHTGERGLVQPTFPDVLVFNMCEEFFIWRMIFKNGLPYLHAEVVQSTITSFSLYVKSWHLVLTILTEATKAVIWCPFNGK